MEQDPHTEVLSTLPPELFAEVLSCLSTRDLCNLLTVNQEVNTAVTRLAPTPLKLIFDRNLSRLRSEIEYLNFSGVPFDVAIRRWGFVFGKPWCEHRPIHFMSAKLCEAYHRANPTRFQSPGHVAYILRWLALLDDRLQYVNGDPDAKVPLVSHACGLRMDEALIQATKADAEADKPAQYEELLDVVQKNVPNSFSDEELLEIFERMRTDPLAKLPKANACSSDGLDSRLEKLRVRGIVRAKIDIPSHVNGIMIRLITPSRRAKKLARSAAWNGNLSMWRWAALMEDVQIYWVATDDHRMMVMGTK
ncbi:hypothetical protein LTR37_017326 [Vermiconidia calcicola]|uniref:Uncharacterized protein n=1 Tax=Vermiconidia calcicola TaxID=1690605 RepID=A0ACC3MLU7_9PEZI|nr:hypothetical protein LTR37_017326 [Vermiconidia calcicola]